MLQYELLSPGIKGTKFRETYRSSLPEEFGALENFAKFAEKHRFSTKVTGLQPSTLLKTRLWHRCFPVSFAKFLITTFSAEYPPWPLLYIKLSRTSVVKNCQNWNGKFSKIMYYSIQWLCSFPQSLFMQFYINSAFFLNFLGRFIKTNKT